MDLNEALHAMSTQAQKTCAIWDLLDDTEKLAAIDALLPLAGRLIDERVMLTERMGLR